MDNLKQLIERFKRENGQYPNSSDFDNTVYLPSIRSIQRKYGGLIKLKKGLGIIEYDGRKTVLNSNRTKQSMKKSDIQEKEIYRYFVKLFGLRNVHRESPYTENSKVRSDFILYIHKTVDTKIAIDIFYAEHLKSLVGCINAKLNKIDFSKLHYDIYLVSMNPVLDMEIKTKVSNKKIKLPNNVKVISKSELLTVAKKYASDKL